MKKILITTIHPAPYIDLWLNILRKEYIVDLMCLKSNVQEKCWKKYENKDFNLYSDFTFLEKIKYIQGYDLVIFGGLNIYENILLTLLLKYKKIKTAFFCDHPIVLKKKSRVFFFFKKIIFNSANYLFAASESTKKYYKHEYNLKDENILVFPYSHSKPQIDISVLSKKLKNRINKIDKIELFIANRFEKRKGYEIVFKAFSILSKNNDILDNFNIKIAGNGSEFDNYKTKFSNLSKNIELLGWIENDEYEILLENCDVYLHASIFEPFGIPPLDALARGKTVIISNGVKCIDLLIKNKKIKGIYNYDPVDFENLALILKHLTENKESLYNDYPERLKFLDLHFSDESKLDVLKNIFIN